MKKPNRIKALCSIAVKLAKRNQRLEEYLTQLQQDIQRFQERKS